MFHILSHKGNANKKITEIQGKKELLYNAGGNVNYRTHYGNQYGGSLKKPTELLYDPAIPLLSIYPKECKSTHS
jgi:hypothetical protein